jgi:phosphatidylcholine synthase
VLAILTFVPTRHLYPSQPGRINRLATLLGIPWAILFVWVIWSLPRAADSRIEFNTMVLAWVSLAYPAFYLGVSWVISLKYWQRRARNA